VAAPDPSRFDVLRVDAGGQPPEQPAAFICDRLTNVSSQTTTKDQQFTPEDQQRTLIADSDLIPTPKTNTKRSTMKRKIFDLYVNFRG
jgi:hypothetical protein